MIVTVLENAYDATGEKFRERTQRDNEFSAVRVLACIKTGGQDGRLIRQTIAVRGATDIEQRKLLKSQMGMVMWQGTFSARRNNCCKALSGLVCIDFDHLPQDELCEVKRRLQSLPWVYAYFTSPSGDGLKVLALTDNFDVAMYQNCYTQVMNKLWEITGQPPDFNCRALSQACYLPYDPDLYVSENPCAWHFEYDETLDKGVSAVGGEQSGSTNPFELPEPTFLQECFNRASAQSNNLSDEDIIYILEKIWDSRYPYAYRDGYRTKSIFVRAKELCLAGVEVSLACEHLISRFSPTGYSVEKARYEIHRAYQKFQSMFWTTRGKYMSPYNYWKSKHGDQ